MRKTYIAGNWKMSHNIADSMALAIELIDKLADEETVEIGIAPSYTALFSVAEKTLKSNIALLAQNMHDKESGAFTGEISPVNAPCSSKYIFWAASPILAGPMASRTAARAVKGGPSTTSTFSTSITPRRTPRVSSTASATVLCIFQLPAMIGVRIKSTPLMWVSVARILPHTPTSGNVLSTVDLSGRA